MEETRSILITSASSFEISLKVTNALSLSPSKAMNLFENSCDTSFALRTLAETLMAKVPFLILFIKAVKIPMSSSMWILSSSSPPAILNFSKVDKK